VCICVEREVTLQVGDYLVSIVNSSDASISFQAAQSLLQLTQILSSKPNSGGIRAVAGVASSWGPLAVAALLQLWDRQLSFAGHAQLMVVLTEHLPCLQVSHTLQRLLFASWMSTPANWHALLCSSQILAPNVIDLTKSGFAVLLVCFGCECCSVSQTPAHLTICHCCFVKK